MVTGEPMTFRPLERQNVRRLLIAVIKRLKSQEASPGMAVAGIVKGGRSLNRVQQ